MAAEETVTSVLNGYNGTIMAYGQTGAGKTFTITGGTANYQERGLSPRCLAHIFREIGSRPEHAFVVRVSYLEVYNEKMYDLLATAEGAPEGAGTGTLSISEENGTVHVKGLTQMICATEEEALSYLFEGETNRAIAAHQLNRNSTRSHCVFTVYVESRSRVESTEKVTRGKLNLVDLAGSERIKKTGSDGVILQEAMYINKSLTFLEQVVLALADRSRDHIPYRQSILTNVLKDSLGGNSKTLMCANIWGQAEHLEETISTLKFASRMMRISNEVVVNVQQDPSMLLKKYEREIRDLRQELAMHDTLANQSRRVYEDYTEEQRYQLKVQMKKWVDNEIDELEPEDLVKFGLIPEFVGRLPVISNLHELDENALVRILKEPKNALVNQYKHLFEIDDVDLTFRDEALLEIAKQAIKRKTGARGLRSIMEDILMETMFELPNKDLEKVIIDENTVISKTEPIKLLKTPPKKSSVN